VGDGGYVEILRFAQDDGILAWEAADNRQGSSVGGGGIIHNGRARLWSEFDAAEDIGDCVCQDKGGIPFAKSAKGMPPGAEYTGTHPRP
jgi:hypothetical protein